MSAAPREAVFDLDGVFLTSDTFATLARRQFRREPHRAVRVAWDSPVLASAWLRRRTRPGALARLAHRAVDGLTAAEYTVVAESVGRELARGPSVLPAAVAEVRRLRAAGYRVTVATASERILASAFLAELGLADEVIVCSSELDFTTGKLSPHCQGEHKVAAIDARLGITRWQIAYTDSASDLPLLQRAERAVVVNPARHTAARIAAQLGRWPDVVQWPTRTS